MNAFDKIHGKVKRAVEVTIPQAIAREGVNHFRQSFKDQRYNEAGSQPWQEVKRREKNSGWYGFKYGSKTRRPKKYGGGKNYIEAATSRAILFGSGSSKLRDSIFIKEASARGVEWASSSDHATIHNQGGRMKVFGKHSAVMPKRQFMGMGTRLKGKIKQTVRIELHKALK